MSIASEDKQSFCSIIVVTYNSEKHIKKCLESIFTQSQLPKQVIIVDTGSKDFGYLHEQQKLFNIEIHYAEQESGFCKGNNLGWQNLCPSADYVLLLNPDAFLQQHFIKDAIAFMENPSNAKCGALTGKLFGYNIENDAPTHCYDSTGIFQTRWGKWYDRHQGSSVDSIDEKSLTKESIPAICGALFFCRVQALKTVLLRKNEILDSSFYMYKEDIDLSLRLKSKGWSLYFLPHLSAYHCRGWNPSRKAMPHSVRMHSARNELKLHIRQARPIPMLYSAFKYLAVKYLNV